MFTGIRKGILAMILLAATAMTGQASAETLINGAGATFPYPLYSKWFAEYAKVDPTVKFNYQSIGSGGGIKQITSQTVDFGASDMATFWLLHTINSSIPILSHLYRAPDHHPEQLYSALVRLAGELSTFALQADPRDLPSVVSWRSGLAGGVFPRGNERQRLRHGAARFRLMTA